MRRTPEQTRRLLLDAGLELLHEHGAAPGVGHIRLQDVVARAGLTTGAAYRIWDNQGEYHRDLAVEAVSWRERPSIEATVNSIRHLIDSGAPLPEIVRVGCDANLHEFPDSLGFLLTIAVRAAAPADDVVLAASRHRYDEGLEAFEELYDAILHWSRRRMVAPLELDHFTRVAAALSEGFALHSITGATHPRVRVQAPGDDRERDWSLLGLAVMTMIDLMTEPIDAVSAANEPSDRRTESAGPTSR